MCCGTNSNVLACIANTWNCRIGTQRNVSPGTMLFPICGSVVPERDGTYQYESVCEEKVGVLTRNVKERMENQKTTAKLLAERERTQPERYGT